MTPDLTAIVESVADLSLAHGTHVNLDDSANPTRCACGGKFPNLSAHRAHLAELTVRATLTALMPLADGWDSIADEFHDKATAAYQEGGRDIAGAAWRAIADTNRRHAEELRGVTGS